MAAVSLFWDTNMAVVTSCENTLYSNQAPRENSNFANTSLLRIPRWQWQQINSLQKYYTNFRIKKYQLKYIFVWPLYMLRSRLTGKPVQYLFTIEWSLLTVHVIVRSGFPITAAITFISFTYVNATIKLLENWIALSMPRVVESTTVYEALKNFRVLTDVNINVRR